MLEKGALAPDFSLPNQSGKSVSLKNFSGKWLVLYFYPKDMTPGCTTEAVNFDQVLGKFKKVGASILGVSKDSVERHKKFAGKYNLKFPLLNDENYDACKVYGVWQKKKLYGREFMGIVRSTFIIDPHGKILKIYSKVDVKNHYSEVLGDIKAFNT